MLSTRPDLVGQDVAAELTHLQSQTPPDSSGVAEATIQKELGSPAATLFASFEPTPFASASIAQVHHARLHSGENVVVKVQKDGIESRVEADLSVLADLAALAERHSTTTLMGGAVATHTMRGESAAVLTILAVLVIAVGMTNRANSGTVDRGFGTVPGQFSPEKRSTRKGNQQKPQ
jgi:hypothetical protein